MRVTIGIIVALATVALTPCFSQGPPNAKIQALCDATLAALQKTDAPPMVDTLSGQSSSLIVVTESGLVRTCKSKLKGQATWTATAPLSAAAKLTEAKATPGSDATHVEATVDDGGKQGKLDGMALIEGGKGRWLMLALVPQAADSGSDADRAAIGAHLDALRQNLTKGDMDAAVKAFAPDFLSFSVAGPDYGFYAFPTPPEVRAFLVGQATAAGPLDVPPAQPPQLEFHGPVALGYGMWDITVATFPVQPTEIRWHLYREGDAWKVAAVCALRKD